MNMLMKKMHNETLYWEVSQSGRRITIEFGVLGVNKETEEIQLGFFESGKKIIRRLVEEKLNQGYEHYFDQREIKVILQNRYDTEDINQFREKCYALQDTINEALLSTGIGFDEGISISDAEAIFSFNVVDVESGLNTILKELSEQDLENDVQISLLADVEKYVSLYPEREDF